MKKTIFILAFILGYISTELYHEKYDVKATPIILNPIEVKPDPEPPKEEKPKLSLINYTQPQRECLAKNVYHEARSQAPVGQMAVAFVTLNRVESDKFPDTICEVVYQGKYKKNGQPVKDKCSFSWWCDGKSDFIGDKGVYAEIHDITDVVLDNYKTIGYDVTEGSLFYHADFVKPYWINKMRLNVTIDNHIFYSPRK